MRYIVAQSRLQAESTAQVDWNWQRVGREEWIDHEGERVRYADSIEQLQGVAPGTVIWLGYRWYNNPNFKNGALTQFGAWHRFDMKQAADWLPNSIPRRA